MLAKRGFECDVLLFRAGVGMMYVTNNSLKSDVEGTPETYDNALSEAWRYLENTRKVI